MKKPIGKYAIIESAWMLGIGEKASMKEIKEAYRKLLHEWHPDKFQNNHEERAKMTQKITNAYSIIIEYCENYTIDFSEKKITNTNIDYVSETFWEDHFGEDPLWGGASK